MRLPCMLRRGVLLLFVVISECFCQPNEGKSDRTLPIGEKGLPVMDESHIAPFDTNIRDDCRKLLEYCQSHIFGHIFLQCPGLCTKYLAEEGMIGTADDNPDALYEVGSLPTYFPGNVDADRFEGYVLVFAIVPLLPGMVIYYESMLESLHRIFYPKVEFVILPIDHNHGIHFKVREGRSVVILAEESPYTVPDNHPWVRHLTAIRPRTGLGTTEYGDGVTVEQRPLQTDRVSIYIVSADGYYIEQLISPTMKMLKEKIQIYTKSIDYEL